MPWGPQWAASMQAKQGRDRSESIALLVCKIICCCIDKSQPRAHREQGNQWRLHIPGEAGLEQGRKGRAGEPEDLGYTLG